MKRVGMPICREGLGVSMRSHRVREVEGRSRVVGKGAKCLPSILSTWSDSKAPWVAALQ